MKQKALSEFSREELQSEVKKRSAFFTVFVFMVFLMVGTAIYLTIKSGYGVFTILPVAFVPLVLMIKKTLADAKKELASRA
jgi:Mn2+/Fe2+ NRAMP family transporter